LAFVPSQHHDIDTILFLTVAIIVALAVKVVVIIIITLDFRQETEMPGYYE
jgi:hypothetical protein